jgi:hypothetical protein
VKHRPAVKASRGGRRRRYAVGKSPRAGRTVNAGRPARRLLSVGEPLSTKYIYRVHPSSSKRWLKTCYQRYAREY